MRVWLPDRPGALGAVASRVGAVGGDVVGIEILERGGGRAVDELVVELPDESLVDLLVAEMTQVDGVDVEDVRPLADALHDPRLDALETAAQLVGATSGDEILEALCERATATIGAEWAVVVDLDDASSKVEVGDAAVRRRGSLAFVAGSRSSAQVAAMEAGPDDVLWAPLPAANLALVMGRDGTRSAPGSGARRRRWRASSTPGFAKSPLTPPG